MQPRFLEKLNFQMFCCKDGSDVTENGTLKK